MIIPDDELQPIEVSGHPGPGQSFDFTVIDDPCDPATPPTAEPAEPSSGGVRSTAVGASACCYELAADVRDGYLKSADYGNEVAVAMLRKDEGAVRFTRFSHCPYCGTAISS